VLPGISRSALALIGAAILAAGPAVGGEVPVLPVSAEWHWSGRTAQAALEDEAMRFARAWVDRDYSVLESMMVPDGLRLHVQGELFPSVDLRRAAVALRGLLGRYEGGEVELMRVSRSTGQEGRGFADLQWRTRVAGTGEVAIFTLFIAFELQERGWVVNEIRVLP